jgi:hypothetical protein
VRVGSSPDNAGTAWYCQTGWVRLARREGVREEPAAERPSRRKTPAPIWRMWAGQRRAPAANGGELVGRLMSPVREVTVKVCGVAVTRSQGHSWAPHPSNG